MSVQLQASDVMTTKDNSPDTLLLLTFLEGCPDAAVLDIGVQNSNNKRNRFIVSQVTTQKRKKIILNLTLMSKRKSCQNSRSDSLSTKKNKLQEEEKKENQTEGEKPLDLKLAFWKLQFAIPNAKFYVRYEPSQNTHVFEVLRFHEDGSVAEITRPRKIPRINCIQYSEGKWIEWGSCNSRVYLRGSSFISQQVHYITRNGRMLYGICEDDEFHYDVSIKSAIDGVTLKVPKVLNFPSHVSDLLYVIEQNSDVAVTDCFWEDMKEKGRDILHRQISGRQLQKHLLPELIGFIFDFLYESCEKREGKTKCQSYYWTGCLECSESE